MCQRALATIILEVSKNSRSLYPGKIQTRIIKVLKIDDFTPVRRPKYRPRH